MFDAQSYRSREEVEAWRLRDPLERLRARMRDNHLASAQELLGIEQAVEQELAAAVAFAEAGTLEAVEDLERFVLMDQVVQESAPGSGG